MPQPDSRRTALIEILQKIILLLKPLTAREAEKIIRAVAAIYDLRLEND